MIIYMSVNPKTPFYYEPSGMQLSYPLTIGLLIYVIGSILNIFLLLSQSRVWMYMPIFLAIFTSFPVLLHLMNLLLLPESNILLYYYGIVLGMSIPIILFLLIRELLLIYKLKI